MSVRVGSARIDERGSAIGGKAGDQTGREVFQMGNALVTLSQTIEAMAKEANHEKVVESGDGKSD